MIPSTYTLTALEMHHLLLATYICHKNQRPGLMVMAYTVFCPAPAPLSKFDDISVGR